MAANCKPNRAQRLMRLLRTGPVTPWQIVQECRSTTPSKVVSEARRYARSLGMKIVGKRVAGESYKEYSLVRP